MAHLSLLLLTFESFLEVFGGGAVFMTAFMLLLSAVLNPLDFFYMCFVVLCCECVMCFLVTEKQDINQAGVGLSDPGWKTPRAQGPHWGTMPRAQPPNIHFFQGN